MKTSKISKMSRLLPVIILFFVTCDIFDLNPQQQVSDADAFQSLSDFQEAIIGCYDQMQKPDWYGRYMLLIPDIMGEDVKKAFFSREPNNWAEYDGYSQSSIPRGLWAEIYKCILMTNQMINASYEPGEGVLDEYNQLIGEAHAIRALCYFDLVRLFAQHYTYTPDASHPGVPIVLEADVFAKPARNTVAEVYAQIIADFNYAITLMTGNPPSAGYLSKEAVQALLSRVYLYKEDYTNAEVMATAVINSGKYSLVPAAAYPTQFLPGLSSEAIFEIIFTADDNHGHDHLGGMYKAISYGDFLPAKDLLNQIDENDVRKSMFLHDENLLGIYASMRVNKYPSTGDETGQDNIPVIRLSEVYLNRAEARSKLGNDAGAQADLNIIRKRALAAAPDIALTGDALLAEILLERRRELCYEGHRLFDITRHKKDLVRVDCTSVVCSVAYPDYRFILPIPIDEIDVNPNITQNPGY